MTKVKPNTYETSLKAKWDTQNAFDTIIKEEQAKAEIEKIKSASSLKKLGVLTNQQIAESSQSK